jgi:hypothetical protein
MNHYGKLLPAGLVAAGALACLALIFGRGDVKGADPHQNEENLIATLENVGADYDRAVARVVSILGDEKVRTANRPAMIKAIQLAGKLRAKEAVPLLVDLLLYGKKEDIQDRRDIGKQPEPPDVGAPAVEALIDIGVPSLGPVSDKLAATATEPKNKHTLRLHCTWVIWKVLGTDLGYEYLVLWHNKNPQAKEVFEDVKRFFEIQKKLEGRHLTAQKLTEGNEDRSESAG